MSTNTVESTDIQISTPEQTEACHERVSITITAAAVDAAYDRAEKRVMQGAKVPGFRPGKTPMNLIRRRYAKQIDGEVRDDLVNTAFRKALSDESVQPITMPSLSDDSSLEPTRGQDLTFSMDYDVAPSFEMPEYKGLALTRPANAVDDARIDEFLDNFRRQRATLSAVERPAEAGDILRVAYSSELALADGEEVPEPAKRLLDASEQWVMLQEPEIIPGAIDGLTGAEKGSEVKLDVTFPEDYHEPFLAGKTAAYTFTINEINAHVLPEVDDEFAKGLGMDSADELKGMVRERLEDEAERGRHMALQNQIFEKLIEGQDFTLPPRVLEREKHMAFQELHRQHHEQGHDANNDDHSHPELHDEAADRAEKRLRFQYVVEKIAEAEGISVDDQEVQMGLEQLRQRQNLTQQKFESQYDMNALANSLRWDFLRNKTLAKLVDLAEVTDEAAPEAAETDEKKPAKKKAAAKKTTAKKSTKSDDGEKKPAAKKKTTAKKTTKTDDGEKKPAAKKKTATKKKAAKSDDDASE